MFWWKYAFWGIFFLKKGNFLESLQLYNLQIINFLSINGETQECLTRLPSLFSCRSGIHGKELKLVIVLNF